LLLSQFRSLPVESSTKTNARQKLRLWLVNRHFKFFPHESGEHKVGETAGTNILSIYESYFVGNRFAQYIIQ
jgi:hypothetical protein